MTGMTTAWAAWTQFHAGRGFAIEHFLNPPAPEADLAAIETETGYRLPDDLRELWRRADGQPDSYRIASPAPGTVISPVFGSYDFMACAAALAAYRDWTEVLEEYGDTMNDGITRREGDPVQAAYWIPGWLPFAIDGGGNFYAVDMAPDEGGTYGQVILMGPDEDERRVLGTGIAAWLTKTVQHAPPLDDEAEPPLAHFDMEYRTPHSTV